MICSDAGNKNSRPISAVATATVLFKTTLAVATSLVLTLTSPIAIAGPPNSFTEYARVLRVEPAYRNVTVRAPEKFCRPAAHYDYSQNRYNHNYYPQNPPRSNRSHRSHRSRRSYNNAEVFVGGAIGGAIGRELSRSATGRPSTGATIAGALIGSAITSQIRERKRRHTDNYSREYQRQPQRQLQQRYVAPTNRDRDYRIHEPANRAYNRHHNHNRRHCSTTTRPRTVRQRDGFTVTYHYRGHRYQTVTQHHPGERLAITVTLDPQRR